MLGKGVRLRRVQVNSEQVRLESRVTGERLRVVSCDFVVRLLVALSDGGPYIQGKPRSGITAVSAHQSPRCESYST